MRPSARRRPLLQQFHLTHSYRFNHSFRLLALVHLNNKAPNAHHVAHHRKGIAAAQQQTEVCASDYIIHYACDHDDVCYLDGCAVIEDHEYSDQEQHKAEERDNETDAAGGYDSDIYVRVRTLHLYYILFLYLKPSSLVLLPHGIPKRFLSKLRVV